MTGLEIAILVIFGSLTVLGIMDHVCIRTQVK